MYKNILNKKKIIKFKCFIKKNNFIIFKALNLNSKNRLQLTNKVTNFSNIFLIKKSIFRLFGSYNKFLHGGQFLIVQVNKDFSINDLKALPKSLNNLQVIGLFYDYQFFSARKLYKIFNFDIGFNLHYNVYLLYSCLLNKRRL